MLFPGALEMYFSPCTSGGATLIFFLFLFFCVGPRSMKISLVFIITHYTPLQPTTHTYKPLSWKKLRELVSMYYEVNRTAILCRSMLFFLCIVPQNRSNVDFRQMRRSAFKPPRTKKKSLCLKIAPHNDSHRPWPAQHVSHGRETGGWVFSA